MTALSVDELSALIKNAVEQDPLMAQVAVRGEIVDFKRHTSGHVFFTLGGEKTRIACVMFKADLKTVLSWPSPGDDVMVGGRVSVYPERGIYQLYARRILPLGQGAIDKARKEIRRKLALEGLFDEERKRPVPPYPGRIACITSPTGAAVRDVIKVAGSRNPGVDLVIIPSAVQGIEAPERIVKAFSMIPRIAPVDLVMLVRGGGSRDDLSAFDDPDVVRAVASCPVPVIVGVGHQIDVTLADSAADCRCSTPSEAAEMAVPSVMELELRINSLKKRLLSPLLLTARKEAHSLGSLRQRLIEKTAHGLGMSASVLSALKHDMRLRLSYKVSREASRLAKLSSALRGTSPLSVLKRGFAALRDRLGRPVPSAGFLSPGDTVFLDCADGEVMCEVKKVSVFQRKVKVP